MPRRLSERKHYQGDCSKEIIPRRLLLRRLPKRGIYAVYRPKNGVCRGKIWQNNSVILGHWLGNCFSKILIIGLKAPENYSASIWFNIFSVCLWRNPQTLISMILGFWDPPPSPNANYVIFRDTKIPHENQENP